MIEAQRKQAPGTSGAPILSERAWGSVREDYSDNGDAWSFFPYEDAVSRSYRWSDGLAGLSDIWRDIRLGMAFWNGRDSHLKGTTVPDYQGIKATMVRTSRSTTGTETRPRRTAAALAVPLPAG